MKSVKKRILLVVLLSYFVTAIDSSIVITGLTKMSEQLNLSQTELSWVQNAYVLSFGCFILIAGKLSDTLGRKCVLNSALILFGISSMLAGISWNAVALILARFMQGIGAAILAPTSLALLMDTFDGEELVKYVAWYSSVSGLGSSIGLVAGGYFASYMSWRIGFFINCPITLFMLLICIKDLQPHRIKGFTLDIFGTIFSITGIFMFVYAIDGATNPALWILGSIVSMVAFIVIEKKTNSPILPLELFKSRIRTGAYISRFFYMCAMLGFWFYISEYLQKASSFSPIRTGVAFFPMTVSMFITAVIVPGLVSKYGNRWVLLSGVSFLIAGFICMLNINAQSSYLINIMGPMVLFGFGQGLAMCPLTNYGICNVDEEHAGSASGLVNAAHQIGGSVGLSVMVTAGSFFESIQGEFHIAMKFGLVFIVLMGLTQILFHKK